MFQHSATDSFDLSPQAIDDVDSAFDLASLGGVSVFETFDTTEAAALSFDLEDPLSLEGFITHRNAAPRNVEVASRLTREHALDLLCTYASLRSGHTTTLGFSAEGNVESLEPELFEGLVVVPAGRRLPKLSEQRPYLDGILERLCRDNALSFAHYETRDTGAASIFDLAFDEDWFEG